MYDGSDILVVGVPTKPTPDVTFTPSDCFGWLQLHTDKARAWFAAVADMYGGDNRGTPDARGICIRRDEVAELREAMRGGGLVVKS